MTDHLGLTSQQVKTLQAQYGKNTLPEKQQRSIFDVFFSQFKSPLVFVLLIVSGITLFLREYSDTVVILIVVVVNAIIGSIQELKALHSLQSLKQFLTPKAKVYRDGKLQVLSVEELVPGDIVSLEAGDRVPADGVLIEANSMTVNESQLTGEVYPVSKDTSEQAGLAMGTLLASGKGLLKVEQTGEATALGQISKTVAEHVGEATPLERQLNKLLRVVLLIVIGVCGVLFVIGFIEHIPLEELFKTVVSIGVSAIPEGLPIVITVTLALGVVRMSQKKAILRNLPSVSTLAGVDVICTDKTGTLTEGKIVLQEAWYFDDDKFEQKKKTEMLRLAVLCNDARTDNTAVGDLLDLALIKAAFNDHVDVDKVRAAAPRISELAFDNRLRLQATLHQTDKNMLLVVKGAPDSVLTQCCAFHHKEQQVIEKQIQLLTDRGLRVIALAEKTGKHLKLKDHKDIKDLNFTGLLVFSDTLRSDAAASIQKCKNAGIQVIMITGDHLNTAKSIGEQIGLYHQGNIAVEGKELENLLNSSFSPENLTIVARATPFDKSALIDQLKAQQKLVAMTGDGVNDAPALAKADIGIAMGKSGTDAAREAADMILVDDSFSTIVHGISAARGVFENIRKVISYLFTTSYGELGVIFLSLFLGLPLPLLAAQILWLNLITDGLLDISISTEKSTPQIMERSHKRYKGHIIDKLLLLRIILLGTIMSVGTIVIFLMELESHSLEYSRTVALIVLAIFQWVHALNSRSETRSIFTMGFLTNRAVVVAIGVEAVLLALAVYHPLFQSLLRTVPVEANVWIVAVAVSLSVLVVEELRKYLFRRFDWKKYFTVL